MVTPYYGSPLQDECQLSPDIRQPQAKLQAMAQGEIARQGVDTSKIDREIPDWEQKVRAAANHEWCLRKNVEYMGMRAVPSDPADAMKAHADYAVAQARHARAVQNLRKLQNP